MQVEPAFLRITSMGASKNRTCLHYSVRSYLIYSYCLSIRSIRILVDLDQPRCIVSLQVEPYNEFQRKSVLDACSVHLTFPSRFRLIQLVENYVSIIRVNMHLFVCRQKWIHEWEHYVCEVVLWSHSRLYGWNYHLTKLNQFGEWCEQSIQLSFIIYILSKP